METKRLLGKTFREQFKAEVREEIAELAEKGIRPGLAVILAGDDPASQVYVRSKTRTCEELGMGSQQINLPAETSTQELLARVGDLNRDDAVDGILIQLPLPRQVDTDRVLQAVHPAKDVDGFHPSNLGKLFSGRPALAPCTPMGILEMLKREGTPMRGAEAVVVGRSIIVGKPMAMLLLQNHCTVTICHSRTRDLGEVCRRADILVVAVGVPALVQREHIKPGAVVVDVGMNRITEREQALTILGPDSARFQKFEERGSVLIGDVHPEAAWGIASAATPVPGGVGPLTIGHLMKNTVQACRQRRGRPTRFAQESH